MNDPVPNTAQQNTAKQNPPVPLDPAFFTCTNTYLDIANTQAKTQGLKRVSAALMYATTRYNAHAYLGYETNVDSTRAEFLDYMTQLYRNMLEQNLDNLVAERSGNTPAQ